MFRPLVVPCCSILCTLLTVKGAAVTIVKGMEVAMEESLLAMAGVYRLFSWLTPATTSTSLQLKASAQIHPLLYVIIPPQHAIVAISIPSVSTPFRRNLLRSVYCSM